MKRAMVAVVVTGTTCAVLLSGCGGGHARLGRAGGTGTSVSGTANVGDTGASSGATGAAGTAAPGPDASLASVDNLLNQLDTQVNADAHASRDSD